MYKLILEEVGLINLQYIAIIALRDKAIKSSVARGVKQFSESNSLTAILEKLKAVDGSNQKRDPEDAHHIRVGSPKKVDACGRRFLGMSFLEACALTADEFKAVTFTRHLRRAGSRRPPGQLQGHMDRRHRGSRY